MLPHQEGKGMQESNGKVVEESDSEDSFSERDEDGFDSSSDEEVQNKNEIKVSPLLGQDEEEKISVHSSIHDSDSEFDVDKDS